MEARDYSQILWQNLQELSLLRNTQRHHRHIEISVILSVVISALKIH